MTDMFARLAEPFAPDRVSWRVGSMTKDKSKAMALAYIDARDVMERLDAVCGPAGWERRHPHVTGTTTCEIAIWIEGKGWVVKSDGAGDTQVEAEKGSLSDSFKRAAVNWGVGRYLYDLDSPWVELDERQRIKPAEMTKLRGVLQRYQPNIPPPPAKSETGGRKSSAQAKRDGDHEKYTSDIAGLDKDGLLDWTKNFDAYTADAPVSWLDPLRDKLELRREELFATTNGDAGEMDEAFRATMGRGGTDE
jgi:hypothetical protein